MIYDVIIIGSGISGLYAAYRIKKHNPTLSVLVLEKHKKRWIGGRASTESFFNTEIVTGAGIGRKQDKLLKTLQKELGFEVNEFTSLKILNGPSEPDILDILRFLRSKYSKYRGPSITFEKFAKPLLGPDYNLFLFSSGYTDYEKEDVQDTLTNYGMEDNACCLTGFGVHWHKTILELAAKIGESNIKFAQNVVSISGEDDRVSVKTENREYNCKKLIVATTITSLRNLFPRHPIYKEIEGQPFLRVYGKFAKQSIPIMKEYVRGYTCVTGPIQKMIPINEDDGVYMIVYNDNANAISMKSRTENTAENREFYCVLIERTLDMPAGSLHLVGIRSFYWPVGTHYYVPLSKKYKDRDEFIDAAQHPGGFNRDNVLVVGEVVSKHQGWVEGALESVNAVLTKKWMDIYNMPYQYSNIEIKMLPNGRKTVRKVYVKNGKGYKTVTKYRRGRKLSSVKRTIHVDHINKIKKCEFVPGLFVDCVRK